MSVPRATGALLETIRREEEARRAPDPDQAAAEELSSWAEGKLTRLGGQPTREAVWGVMLLLQKRFFLLRRRSQEPSWQSLMVVYERYYDRLELVLEEADPPLPMASGLVLAPPPEAGVELFEDET